MSPEEISEIIRNVGIIGVLGLIIWSGVKKWWVWGWMHERIVADKDAEIQRLREEKDSAIERIQEECREHLKKGEKEVEEWKYIALRATNLAELLQSGIKQ